MKLDFLINLIVLLFTLVCFVRCFRPEGFWDAAQGRRSLRFFTILSNLFSAFASLCVLLTLRETGLPYGVWLLRYAAAVSVTVTFLTVMVFLGPTVGYKSQLEGSGLFFHLSGPLLALLSFCFLERWYTLRFAVSLLGILPVLLYGLVYYHRVVVTGKWEDFYGFNRGGKWPVSFAGMMIEAFLVCMLIRLLCRL